MAGETFSDPDFIAFIAAPSVPIAVKLNGIQTLLPNLDRPLQNLISLMTINGIADRFLEMSDVFRSLLDEHRRIGRAQVTTAVLLDDARRERLRARLTELTGYDRIEITEAVDPAILGGVIARVGDRLIDGSAFSKLRSLRDALADRPVSI